MHSPILSGEFLRLEFVKTLALVLLLALLGGEVFAQTEKPGPTKSSPGLEILGPVDTTANLRDLPLDEFKKLIDVTVLKSKAEKGDAESQYLLGLHYQNAKNENEAVKWVRFAAEQGYARAQGQLGLYYRYGFNVPEDDAEAMRWNRKAADQGDDSAQIAVGMAYEYGHGVQQDGVEAAK